MWFSTRTSLGLDPSPFSGLSDDVAKQYAHAQILYAECLIADFRANGEDTSLVISSIVAENRYRESAASNDSGCVQAGGLQTFICDACDVVLPSTLLCYRCTSCLDFHLCVPCHAKYEHCMECHDFEVVNIRAPVPRRSLCVADVHLRNALTLPSLAAGGGGTTIMKAKACVAECYLRQRRHRECESICRDILQVSCSS
jgi:hypothetical protein